MSIDQSPISRRTVAKGAAWTIPAVAVAGAAPALAASPACEATYTSITKTFVYSALGLFDITVVVTANNVPVNVPAGVELLPISTTSEVTIPENVVGAMKSLYLGADATQIDGTSISVSELTGVVTTTATTHLTIPLTPIPANGPLVTVASGSGMPLTVPAGTAAGAVTITMGEPVSPLTGYDDAGNVTGTYKSELKKKDGNAYVLATFDICA